MAGSASALIARSGSFNIPGERSTSPMDNGRASGNTARTSVLQAPQLLQRSLDDDRGFGVRAARGDPQRAIDLAALDERADDVAAFGLERAQLLGQAEAQLEKPVIDAADLPSQAQRRNDDVRRCKACHAVRHSIESGA